MWADRFMANHCDRLGSCALRRQCAALIEARRAKTARVDSLIAAPGAKRVFRGRENLPRDVSEKNRAASAIRAGTPRASQAARPTTAQNTCAETQNTCAEDRISCAEGQITCVLNQNITALTQIMCALIRLTCALIRITCAPSRITCAPSRIPRASR